MSKKRELRSDGPFEMNYGAGINERDDFNIDIRECTEGQNFILDPVGTLLRRRPVQDLVATAPNAGTISAILQMIKRDDSQTQLVLSDETLYKWNGATIFSDVTPPLFTDGAINPRMRATHWALDDYLILTDLDLVNFLFKWDGSEVTRLASGLVTGSSGSITTLTCAGQTATATTSAAHGYVDGDLVTVADAVETEYNGQFQVDVHTTNGFTYGMACATTPATGTITHQKGAEVKAKYSAVHNNRTWLFNLEVDGVAFPHMCLASDFEDPQEYDNAKRGKAQDPAETFTSVNQAFYILSPDLKPINGAVSFYDKLVISTVNGKLFVLSGATAENYDFDEYYPGSSAQGSESLVNTGNDLVYFRRGKVVESLITTDKYGDVSTDDLSWWIPDLAKSMVEPIMVYDQSKQRVYFFDADFKGVLVLDKEFLNSQKTITDRLSPWTQYNTLMPNEFVTKAATQLRPINSTDTTVYWGCNTGGIYNVNGTGLSGDRGQYIINTNRKSRVITELNTNDELMVGRLEYRRNYSAVCDLIFAWLDELHQETVSMTLKAPDAFADAAFWGGAFYWNNIAPAEYYGAGQNVSDQEQVSSLGFSVPGKSTGFVLTTQVADIDEFIISRVYV